ncbi:MAG: hypothetical protein QS721_05710 [Candidatus Endonucleobacter sp. (ex Gigantidas childressi)]|nr:hypothetical protein [Candidatus Endonucleobacter sp. (ex Gigantidas childressi)]
MTKATISLLIKDIVHTITADNGKEFSYHEKIRRRFTLLPLQLLGARVIPVAFQSATWLAALAHPDHLLLVGSWGFAYLPPSSNLKYFEYK